MTDGFFSRLFLVPSLFSHALSPPQNICLPPLPTPFCMYPLHCNYLPLLRPPHVSNLSTTNVLSSHVLLVCTLSTATSCPPLLPTFPPPHPCHILCITNNCPPLLLLPLLPLHPSHSLFTTNICPPPFILLNFALHKIYWQNRTQNYVLYTNVCFYALCTPRVVR